MIWLYIYLGISALVLLLLWITAVEAECEFNRRYPFVKIPKRSFTERVCTIVRTVFVCMVPVFNVIFFLVLLFGHDTLIEKSMSKLYTRCKEDNDGQSNCMR